MSIDSDEAFVISTMFAHQTVEKRKMFVATTERKFENQTFLPAFFSHHVFIKTLKFQRVLQTWLTQWFRRMQRFHKGKFDVLLTACHRQYYLDIKCNIHFSLDRLYLVMHCPPHPPVFVSGESHMAVGKQIISLAIFRACLKRAQQLVLGVKN